MRLMDDPRVIDLQARCLAARLTDEQWERLKADEDSGRASLAHQEKIDGEDTR